MSRKQRPCPTGKRRFDSHLAGLVEVWICRAKHSMGVIQRLEERVYWCDECQGWHLTSLKEWVP